MRPLALICAVSLISITAFAQRGGGHGGGGGGSRGSSSGGAASHASGFSRGGGAAVRSGGAYRTGGYRGYRNYGYGYGRYGFPYYGWGWGYAWDPYFWGWDTSAPYYDSSSDSGYAGYSGDYQPQPPVIVNQVMPYVDQAPPPPQPVVREYRPPAESTNNGPVLYLFALKNNNILAAYTYWAEKGDLHYVNLDHQMKQIPLSSIDRELTDRLNRERNLSVRLPG